MRGMEQKGFSIVEFLVVIAVILLLGVIGLTTYDQFTVKSRDESRRTELYRFAKQLELYRNEFGASACGDTCAAVSGTYYSFDCSDAAASLTTGNEPEERSGFLNGGDCCVSNGGIPAPTGTPPIISDDSAWGLYRHQYLEAVWPQDPFEFIADAVDPANAKRYSYCYATPAVGRKSYALFVRMENQSLNQNDSGQCAKWFEFYSPGYPASGWTPWLRGGAWAC